MWPLPRVANSKVLGLKILEPKHVIHSLKLTVSPLKIGPNCPKRKRSSEPTIHFQVRFVSFREGNPGPFGITHSNFLNNFGASRGEKKQAALGSNLQLGNSNHHVHPGVNTKSPRIFLGGPSSLQIILGDTRWAPTSYKCSYNPYKWPYNWVTGVISPSSISVGVPPSHPQILTATEEVKIMIQCYLGFQNERLAIG